MFRVDAFHEYRQAIAFLRDGKAEAALVRIGKAVEMDPENAYYISYQGLILAAAEEKWADAEQLCSRAIKSEPRQAQLYLNLAEVYRMAGRKQDASDVLSRGLQQAPRDYRLKHELSKLAMRRPPVVGVLDRQHFLNRQLGRIRHRLLQQIAAL